MSEGAGFVNTALLEEEHDQGLRSSFRTGRCGRKGARHQGVAFDFHNGLGSPVGLPACLRLCWRWDACAGRLQFPTEVRVRRGRSSAAWSCLRRAPLPGPSMERSGAASSAQSHIDDHAPKGGHAVSRAVRWLRPSWLSPRPARGNGSPRRAGRNTPGGAPCGPRRRGRCCDLAARRCGGSRL